MLKWPFVGVARVAGQARRFVPPEALAGWRSLLLAAVQAFALVLGSGGAARAEVTDLPFETVEQTGLSGITTAQTAVLRDERSWRALWARHTALHTPPPPLPAIDFSARTLLAVFAGPKPSLCHGVEVVAVRRQGNGVQVRWRERAPPPERMCAAAIATPVHVVSIARVAGPVAFQRLR